MGRFVWTPNEVTDAHGPAYNVRCYLERCAIREILAEATAGKPLRAGVEVGCGYGRMTMVLAEFCEHVVGFEREDRLVKLARSLLPDIIFTIVPELTKVPAEDARFDVAMTFTVLQHMTDDTAQAVLREVKRLVRREGYVLLVEKTDPASVVGDPADGKKFLSLGRTVETYSEWMLPYRLVKHFPRRIEPTHPRASSAGTYMLFRSREGCT